MEEVRLRIIEAAIKAFNSGGSHFTMDEVANKLGMSKKTIYKYFKSKDDLIQAAINNGFDQVKAAEQAIISNPDMDIIEKLHRTIIVIPEQYKSIDWRKLFEFKDSYPKAFEAIQLRIETGWDGTLMILDEAMKQGRIRKVNVAILKSMIESCIEGFLKNDTLISNGIQYEDALEQMIDIIIEGLKA